MKKILTLIGLLSVFTLPNANAGGGYSEAWAFQAQARCNIQMGQYAECVATNNNSRPMYCRLTAYGMSSSGSWYNQFNESIVYPGNYLSATVFAYNPAIDPMINAKGTFQCRF